MVFSGKVFRKTHDLTELILLCREIDNDFEIIDTEEINEMTIYATELRYPDDFYMPGLNEAEKSVSPAKKVKEFISKKL